MLKMTGRAENPPITSNKIFRVVAMLVFALYMRHGYRLVHLQGKLAAVLYIVCNIMFFTGWLALYMLMTPDETSANRSRDRLLGGWLLFNLILLFFVRVFSPLSAVKTLLLIPVSLIFAGLIVFFFAALETKLLFAQLELVTPKLKRDRVRIVHISDIHAGLWSGPVVLNELVATANEQQPDIIVCTGDLADRERGGDCSEELTILSRLSAREGKFAVLGNHDYANPAEAADFAQQCGFTVLNGEAVKAAGIVIAGCGDRDHLIKQQWGLTKSEQLILGFEYVQAKNFLLVLRHRQLVEDGQKGHFDLQLSGAKHGISLPRLFLRKLGFAPGKGEFRKYSSGGLLYKADGAGYIGMPVRVFCKPEVAVIDLIKE